MAARRAGVTPASLQRLRELEHRTRSLLQQRREALHRLHVLLQKEKVEALRQLREAPEQVRGGRREWVGTRGNFSSPKLR